MAQVITPTPATRVQRRGGFADSVRAFLTYSPGKVKPQVIILFCRQLASFVRVGVPVTTAIETFAEQASNVHLRDTYLTIAADIQRGVRLSDALAAHPRAFPRIVADMVRSAEATGNLDVVLRQAAKHLEREASARQKVRAAMTYPAIIFSLAVVIAIGIVIVVLPQFAKLYTELRVKPPGIVSALLNLSAFVSGHALVILAVLLAGIVAIGVWMRTESGRYARDSLLLHVPVVNALVRSAMTERFCRTLGDMLAAGVPIGQTYAVVMQNVSNRVLRNTLTPVGPALAAGQGMYRPLQAARVFPPALMQLFRVGEETGQLDSNLAEAAEMYENDLDYRIKRMTAVLEPAMVVFVGLIVGFVAVTLILSIYSLAGGLH